MLVLLLRAKSLSTCAFCVPLRPALGNCMCFVHGRQFHGIIELVVREPIVGDRIEGIGMRYHV